MKVRGTSVLIAVVVGALCWLALRDDVDARAPGTLPVQSEPTSSRVSKREFLQSYFGDRWPEVAAQMPATALEDETTFDVALVPPWEQVKEQLTLDAVTDDNDRKREIDQALEWSSGVFTDQVDFAERKYNPFGRKLTDADVVHLRAISKEYDARLMLVGEQAALAFGAAMKELWQSERYERSPIVTPPARKRAGKLRCLRTFAIDNWNIAFSIYSGDFPEYDAAREAIVDLKLKRLSDVNEYIKKLPG